jgi:tetratricopeptide (TPR) repeat protein
MARLPQPGDSRPDQALLGLTWSLQLAELYYRPPSRQLPQDQLDNYLRSQQLDLAREALQSANAYAQVAMQRPELIRRIIPTATQDSDPIPAFLKDIADRESKLTELILPRNDLVDQQSGPDKPVQRFVLAAVMGLPGKAIEAFKEVKNPADFGGPDQYLAAAVQMIELEFRAGRLEDASGDVDALAEVIGTGGKSSLGPTANDILRYLKFRVAHLGGNYEAAGEAWMELFEGRLPQLPADLRSAAVGVQTADVAAAGLIGGGVGSAVYFEWAAARTEQASRLLNLETGFHYNLGILALQEGNIPLATEHLERALKPQGIDLVELGDTVAARQIDTYLQLIRKTHNK